MSKLWTPPIHSTIETFFKEKGLFIYFFLIGYKEMFVVLLKII